MPNEGALRVVSPPRLECRSFKMLLSKHTPTFSEQTAGQVYPGKSRLSLIGISQRTTWWTLAERFNLKMSTIFVLLYKSKLSDYTHYHVHVNSTSMLYKDCHCTLNRELKAQTICSFMVNSISCFIGDVLRRHQMSWKEIQILCILKSSLHLSRNEWFKFASIWRNGLSGVH